MSLPPSPDRESILQTGRDAHARHAWREAFEMFTTAAAAGPLAPDDPDRLAETARWIGRLAACISARERAYGSHTQAGNRRRAAVAAVELARHPFPESAPSGGGA